MRSKPCLRRIPAAQETFRERDGPTAMSSRAKSQRCAAANRIAIVIEMAMISPGAEEEDHGGNSAN